MHKAGFFFFFLLILICGIANNIIAQQSYIILPFKNEGDRIFEKLADYISLYLIHLLKDAPDLTIASYSQTRIQMTRLGMQKDDLKKQEMINKLANAMGISHVIGGYFNNQGDMLFISFDFYEFKKEKFLITNRILSFPLEKNDPLTLNRSFDKLIPFINNIFQGVGSNGFINIKTDIPARLYIDDEICGMTPIRIPLVPGTHEIKIAYEENNREKVIYNETLLIQENREISKSFQVFVPLIITAEKECTIYIDGEEKGNTPFYEKILTGQKYKLDIFYYDENNEKFIVYDGFFDSFDQPEPFFFPSSGTISLDYSSPFVGRISNQEMVHLPHTFTDLPPDLYQITILLEDPKQNKKWCFYKKKQRLRAFQNLIIKPESPVFHKNLMIALIPGIVQFHNREPIKGRIILSVFGGLYFLTITSVFLNNYYNTTYKKLESDYKSWEPIEDIEKQLNNANDGRNLSQGLLIGGIIATSLLYIYSLGDGILTMNRIDTLLNRGNY